MNNVRIVNTTLGVAILTWDFFVWMGDDKHRRNKIGAWPIHKGWFCIEATIR